VSELTFVEQKPMEGREQTLSAGATIGREGCDVNLMDPEVSRRHATIRDQGGSLAIEDLGSTNGTFVNGSRITAVTVLNDGDEVRLGNTVWSIRGAGGGAGATTVGQVPSAAPQVTAARAVPSDIAVPSSPPPAPPPEPQPTTAQQVPAAAVAAAPAAPAAQQPAQPAPPSAAPVGRRGDVEAPPPAPGAAPVFQPPGARPRGSAATRTDATIVCMIIVAAVAAALVIYFVTY
jgi:predicted component of type VI protein secretion system